MQEAISSWDAAAVLLAVAGAALVLWRRKRAAATSGSCACPTKAKTT